MPFEAYVVPLLTILGAVIAGTFTLLGVFIANRGNLQQLQTKIAHDTDRGKRERLSARLEELYTMIGKWAGVVVAHHLTFRQVMEGKMNYNDALDVTIKGDSAVDAHRMFTLAELYFKKEQKTLNEIKKLVDEASDVQNKFKECLN